MVVIGGVLCGVGHLRSMFAKSHRPCTEVDMHSTLWQSRHTVGFWVLRAVLHTSVLGHQSRQFHDTVLL